MSIPSIGELLTAQTSDEVFAVFVQALVNLGVPANKWRRGGVASSMLRVVAITFAGFTSLMVAALSAQFLPYASGNWLTLLAYYVYGVTRTPATFASTSCVLTNDGGGVYSYSIGQFTVKDSVTGVTFTNQALFSLAAAGANPTTATVAFEATVLGSAGNANPGDIDTLVTSALGVSVTNPGPAIGIDQQSDSDLQAECTDSLAARNVRNPRNAYEWAVTTATNSVTGAPVAINRVQVSAPGATYVSGVPLTPPAAGAPGTVTVWCASPSGPASSTDLAGAAQAIEQGVRAEGVDVNVLSATPVNYQRTLNAYARALPGLTAASLQSSAETAIAVLFSNYKVGGLATDNPTVPQGLFGSAVGAAIFSSNPAFFYVEDASQPGNPPPDLPLANGQVAVDEITLNVRLAAST